MITALCIHSKLRGQKIYTFKKQSKSYQEEENDKQVVGCSLSSEDGSEIDVKASEP